MAKDNCKTRWETFKFWDLVRLILEVLRYYCNGRGGRDDHDDEHDDLLLTKLRVVFYLELIKVPGVSLGCRQYIKWYR